MKAWKISLVLVGTLIAVSVSNSVEQKLPRLLTSNESSSIRGAGFAFVHDIEPFKACGIMSQCKENLCDDVQNCVGFETTPVEDVPNIGCAEIDWLSVCVSSTDIVLGFPTPPCATKGDGCFLEWDPIDLVFFCQAVPGNSMVILPTAPTSCTSTTGPE